LRRDRQRDANGDRQYKYSMHSCPRVAQLADLPCCTTQPLGVSGTGWLDAKTFDNVFENLGNSSL
jgi:hypothetical protein